MAARAREHPGGVADLSIGTPVDPTPEVVQAALRGAADDPGYPATAGTPALREAAAGWMRRSLGITVPAAAVLPTIGSKEMVAWLPTLLRLGPGDVVVIPSLAYPTYDVGARLAGADVVVSDDPADVAGARMVWVNSPGNPTGAVLGAPRLRAMVDAARNAGALVVSDECYVEFGWTATPISTLHPDVCGADHAGVIALHSLSKRSNMAGYRFGFAAGDPTVIAGLLEVRKHAGLMVPGPVQRAAVAALDDDRHVVEQRARYLARRGLLARALDAAGFRIDHSEAGLYLWATRDEPCWDTVADLAERGLVVTPGDFYGVAGQRHVRVALTATDDAVALAADRLMAG